jgi:hypothetical protein
LIDVSALKNGQVVLEGTPRCHAMDGYGVQPRAENGKRDAASFPFGNGQRDGAPVLGIDRISRNLGSADTAYDESKGGRRLDDGSAALDNGQCLLLVNCVRSQGA